MPDRLRALLRQTLTVHVPDPAESWRSIYTEGPHRAGPYREKPPPPARNGPSRMA